MIGSNQGQVYTGRQGNQLATVLGPSKSLGVYEGALAKRQAEKAKDAADFSKGTMDIKPEEIWHYYSSDLSKTWEGWMSKGAQMMDKGNPWKRSDKDAVQWQIEGARIRAANENVKQAKTLWDKAMGDINTRGDEYTDEYKESVKNFAQNNPLDKIMSGKFDFPQAEFKNPSTIHQDFLVNGLSNVEKAAGKDAVPLDADFNNYTLSYFSTPEAEKNVIAAKQMFGKLSPDEQNAYIAEAENTPGFKGQGWMAYMNEQLKNRYKKPELDIAQEAMSRAEKAPISSRRSQVEDLSQVTVTSEKEFLANKAYPIEQATSFFTKNSWALSEKKYADQLGVDFNLPLEDRRKKMISAMAKQIENNIETKSVYGVSRQGGNVSDKERLSNYDQWRRSLTSEDRATSTEAANWLVQGLGLKKEQVSSAFVSDNEYDINERAKRAYDQYKLGKPSAADKFKVLQIVFKSPAEMEQAKEKMYKELQEQGIDVKDRKAYTDLLNYYRQEGSYGSVLKIPIMQENEQILKRIHGQTVKETKELYTPIGNKYQAGSAIQQKNAERFNPNPNTKIGSNSSDPLNIRQ